MQQQAIVNYVKYAWMQLLIVYFWIVDIWYVLIFFDQTKELLKIIFIIIKL